MSLETARMPRRSRRCIVTSEWKGSCGLLTDREVRPDDVEGAAQSAVRLGSSHAAPADGLDLNDGRWHIARLIAGNWVISTCFRRPGT